MDVVKGDIGETKHPSQFLATHIFSTGFYFSNAESTFYSVKQYNLSQAKES